MNQKVSRQALAKILAEQLIAAPANSTQIMKMAAAYMMEHGRLGEADLLINDIAHELQEQTGLLSVEVTSALALSKEARDNLITFMKNETNATTVDIHETVDVDLVGGMVARTPDAELDVSVRSKLRKLAAIA
jgi:F-type H+-transporting ATPase subunit delta